MPPRGRKRKSGQSVASEAQDASTMPTTTTTTTTTGQQVAANLDSPAESPRKKRRIGITAAQKQALLDNLQLEVTERARKLRAQYHLQAQGLRTRIEIRINRIPMALRKVKMGDLVQKYAAEQKPLPPPKQTVGGAAGTDRHAVPPPVPEKDVSPSRSAVSRGPPSSPQATRAHAAVGRPMKRLSDALAGGDKENQNALLENPKKRQRGHPTAATGAQRSTQQVLSPASSNSRLNPRDRDRDRAAVRPSSPAKSLLARPLSPTKPLSPAKQAAATNLLSSMVEKARATRAAAATRKATTSSSGSSSAAATGTRTRTRGTGATTATAAGAATNRSTAAAAAAAARTARRASGTSASSDASASTVVRRVGRPAAASTARKATGTKATAAAAAAAAPAAKRTVMSSLKKGVTNATASRKAPAARSAAGATAAAATTTTASTTTRSGRVLRKRD